MDLKRCWVGIGKLFLIFDLQVTFHKQILVPRYILLIHVIVKRTLVRTIFRSYLIWANSRNGHDNCWAEWGSVPCFGDNSRWPGILSTHFCRVVIINISFVVLSCCNFLAYHSYVEKSCVFRMELLLCFTMKCKHYTHSTSTMVDAGNKKCWHWVWKTKSTGTEDYGRYCPG